ncbi:MAG: glycosyltransferase family 4 protein, partial [Candidatus Omnitrophota bacterium]|nr:glycosyltransferase family 4 protein [Candidatus Omnitrophota bacterium]
PQIVHTHTAKAGSIGRLAAKAAGVPVIVHTFHGHVFHSYFSPSKTNLFLAIERMLASITDKIITISEKQKDEIRQYLRLGADDKLVLIPLGFDLQKFLTDKDESALRSELDIPKNAAVIGIVGRLTAIKDHATFLKAAKEIKARNAGKVIKFIIVGGGELKDSLMKSAAGLGLKDDVIFTGWRRDIDALYRVMDIVALTSLNEGTPVSVIEALASAKPVVTTDVGGVRDIVEDGKSGFIVKTGDINAFAGAVTTLLTDKDKREKFGIYGREYILKKHSKERLVNSIIDLYNSELKRKKVI